MDSEAAINYYERHIGDYLKATSHLSLLEHGVYTRLMDVYYTREAAIPETEVSRLIGARSKDEKAALAAVLREFFVLTTDGSHSQPRCDREIARYADKQRKAAASANARWSKPKTHSEGSANAMRTHSEGNAHHTPDTSNQTPDPIQNTHTLSSTAAGRVCLAMKGEGISDPSPGHPDLLALIEAGASDAEFRHAAATSVAKGKGFAYAIGTLKRQRSEAARLTLHQGAMPNPQRPLTPGEQRMLEACPSIVSDSVRQRATPPAKRDVIDAEPTASARLLG